MTGRRRDSRFLLGEPMDGTLRVREEVVIERWDDTEIVVLCSAPSRAAEKLRLEVAGGPPRQLDVSVLESRPVVSSDGSLRHRLRLAVRSDDGGGDGRRES